MQKSFFQYLFLLLILLLAFAARLTYIDAQSIWADEGFTYLTSKSPDILPILQIDVHPPAYFLLMKTWVGGAGDSELSLRYVSTLASLLTVAVVYLIGRELVRMRGENPNTSWIPLIAALLMALADLEIDLAKEARMYTLHTLLAALCVLMYLRLSRKPSSVYAAGLTLSAAALVYVNYLGVWTPLLIGLHALLFHRGRLRLITVGSLTLAAASFLPWLLIVGMTQLGNGVGAERADASTLDTLMRYREVWFGQGWTLTLGLAILGVVGAQFIAPLHRSQQMQTRFFVPTLLVMWALLPLAATYLANNWFPVLAAHRVSQITPAIVLLIALGIGTFQRRTLAFLCLVVVAANLTSVDVYRVKGPWQAYTETITPFVQNNDLVLVEIGGGDTMMEYYFDQLLPRSDVRLLKRWREWIPLDYAANLEPTITSHETIWLLQWSSNTEALDLLAKHGYIQTMHRVTDHLGSRLNSYRYDLPSSEVIATFENGMMLTDAHFRRNKLRVDLIWLSARPIDGDYTTSAFLLNSDGVLVAQFDSQPMLNERPTSIWQPPSYVYDPKPLTLVTGQTLLTGTYKVGVVVYRWSPEGITRILTTDGADHVILDTVVVENEQE